MFIKIESFTITDRHGIVLMKGNDPIRRIVEWDRYSEFCRKVGVWYGWQIHSHFCEYDIDRVLLDLKELERRNREVGYSGRIVKAGAIFINRNKRWSTPPMIAVLVIAEWLNVGTLDLYEYIRNPLGVKNRKFLFK